VRKDKPIISNEVLSAEYSSVYHYVLSLCRDDREAQDITQEAFLKAMKASNSFEGSSSLYTWLCSIAMLFMTSIRMKVVIIRNIRITSFLM